MIALTLDTWVSVGTLLAVAVGLYTALRASVQRVDNRVGELRGDIQRVESGLKTDLQRIETGLKADIQRVESGLKAEIERVDDRVYALAAGLKPDIERAGEQRRGA